ncbi:Poly (ADP-ribose) polymerase [Desmophyllum pertusum]|uniref:Poly [ADP-ribose] polymerase n=1 Tax=Desmophyllum pertusum TaxID=174260 RepID=A0A9W9ZAJ5_9CNID|nr:Poly (ADP-ribose) polymerase [Desmophyllum pertusum]
MTSLYTRFKLPRDSSEYQDVATKFQQTAGGSVAILNIERVQNPHLYQVYQLRKEKMDKDNGGNNERQLFHGTNPDSVTKINAQGFNRSFAGVNAMSLPAIKLPRESSEYQDVATKFQQTAGGSVAIVNIERIQNPHLYQVYQLRKEKMDKDNGGNNERAAVPWNKPGQCDQDKC